MLLKPRLGMRMWSGIWPPSKPLMATPVRAVWPLPPRPEVLPLPEPIPRPTRLKRLWAPSFSRISFSFISMILLRLFDSHEMFHSLDHAAHRRRILQRAGAMTLVEAEALQGFALI